MAEIAAVASVYDALSADRPYRPAYSAAEVNALLQEMAGKQLNWGMVDAAL